MLLIAEHQHYFGGMLSTVSFCNNFIIWWNDDGEGAIEAVLKAAREKMQTIFSGGESVDEWMKELAKCIKSGGKNCSAYCKRANQKEEVRTNHNLPLWKEFSLNML